MDGVLIAGVIVAMLVAVAGYWARSKHGSRNERPEQAHVTSTDPDLDALEQSTMVTPLPTSGGDQALVVGSTQEIDLLVRTGLVESQGPSNRGPLPEVVRTLIAAGGTEANRRAAQGVEDGRIVALSKETMKQLERNPAARDKAGNMLGVVRGKRGFVHVMRLDKAGAKAVLASNATTLAMTAAVSQQLEHIEEQLTEIRETLEEMMESSDLERFANAVATNRRLESIARDIRRRGAMTDADQNQLSDLSLDVEANAIGANLKLDKLLAGLDQNLSRADRVERLRKLRGKQRIDYWLALLVETELAYTRRDLLHLYWEQTRHPETAAQLTDEVRRSVRARQEEMRQVGTVLAELADPEARTWTDPFRQLSRHRLQDEEEVVKRILANHGDAFAGPDADPFAVVESQGTEVLLLEAQVEPARV